MYVTAVLTTLRKVDRSNAKYPQDGRPTSSTIFIAEKSNVIKLVLLDKTLKRSLRINYFLVLKLLTHQEVILLFSSCLYILLPRNKIIIIRELYDIPYNLPVYAPF